MRRAKMLLAAALAAAPALLAGDYVVIANAAFPASEVAAADVKQLFLGAKTNLGGTAAEPVLAEAGAAHEGFLSTVVGKSDSALRNQFKTLVFTGKGTMPKSFKTDAQIVQYVAKTKGAVGYVAAASATADVKKISLK